MQSDGGKGAKTMLRQKVSPHSLFAIEFYFFMSLQQQCDKYINLPKMSPPFKKFELAI